MNVRNAAVFLGLVFLAACSSSNNNNSGGSTGGNPASAVTVSGPGQIVAGTCSALFLVQTVDSNGNPTTNSLSSVSFGVSPGGSAVAYSDAACTTPAGSVALNATGAGAFYVLDTSSETLNITVSVLASASSLTATQSVKVIGGAVAGLTLQGQAIEAIGACNSITLDVVDKFGNVATNSTAFAATLLLNGFTAAALFSDSSCTNSTTTVVIPAGAQGVNFYISDTKVESGVVGATATGLGGVSAQIKFQPAPANLVYLQSGTPVQFLDFEVDVYGTWPKQVVTLQNTSTGDAALVSSLTLPTGFVWDTATTTCVTAASFQLTAGQSCALGISFQPPANTVGVFNGNVTTTYATASTPATNLYANLWLSGIATLAFAESNQPPQLAYSTIGFNTVPHGFLSTQAMTLTNVNAVQSLSIIGVSGFAAPFFVVPGQGCGTFPFTLAAGAVCNLTVEFAPTAVGNYSGSITYTSSLGNSNTTSLTGNSN